MTRKESFNNERDQYLAIGMFDGNCPFSEGNECSKYNWDNCSRCESYVGSIRHEYPVNPMFDMSEADFQVATTIFDMAGGKTMCPFSVEDKECMDRGYEACRRCIHMLTPEDA